jgi:hypothetical protein
MPSTHLSIHLHIIFSTKDREPFIRSEWKADLHGFLGGAIRKTGCIPEAVGGTSDHVHLLAGFKLFTPLRTWCATSSQHHRGGFMMTSDTNSLAGRMAMGPFP